MITNVGKEIIAKYLMGTAPAYASYVALGCGTKPRYKTTTLSSVSSSGTTINVSDTKYIWIGARIEKISGTGTLSSDGDTIVTEILNASSFKVNYAPSVALSGATILIETDPAKKSLDFEMFRVPISSRGYINDGGINKIILTAELPTDERYEITEVGIFSAGNNSTAGTADSKTIYTFAGTEGWTYNSGSTIYSPGSINFPYITDSLINSSNNIIRTENFIQTNANNLAFTTNATRAARYERCRYLNNVFMARGNTSHIDSSFYVQPNSEFLEITGQKIDFSKNSTSDLLKISFSLINVTGDSVVLPDNARIVVQFSNSSNTQYAKLNIDASNDKYYFGNNRYNTISKRLDELSYSSPFSWNNVDTVRIYSSVLNSASINNKAADAATVTLQTTAAHNFKANDIVVISGLGSRFDGTFTITEVPTATSFKYDFAGTTDTTGSISPVPCEASSTDYFIALDAIRLENISSLNPLYGMIGYSIVQSENAETIIKNQNSNNYIEFRFAMDVT